MKKAILFIIYLFLIISCTNKQLDCGSETVQFNVKDILLEHVIKDYSMYYYGFGINEAEIRYIFNEIIEIKQVRTLLIDKEIKQCNCQGKLYFNVSNNANRIIQDDLSNPSTNQKEYRNLLALDGIEVYYNVYETTDGETIVEVKELDNFMDTIISYAVLLRMENDYQSSTNYQLKNVVLKDYEWYEGYFISFQKNDGSIIELYYPSDNLKNLIKGERYDISYKVEIHNMNLEGQRTSSYERSTLTNFRKK